MSSNTRKFEEIEIEGVPVTHVATKADLDTCLASDDNTKIILYQVNDKLQLLFGVDQAAHKIFSHDFQFGRPVSVYGISMQTVDIGSQQRRQDQGGLRFFEPGVGGYGAGNQHTLSLNIAVKELANRIGLSSKLSPANENPAQFSVKNR